MSSRLLIFILISLLSTICVGKEGNSCDLVLHGLSTEVEGILQALWANEGAAFVEEYASVKGRLRNLSEVLAQCAQQRIAIVGTPREMRPSAERYLLQDYQTASSLVRGLYEAMENVDAQQFIMHREVLKSFKSLWRAAMELQARSKS